jgi:hypothetical protein
MHAELPATWITCCYVHKIIQTEPDVGFRAGFDWTPKHGYENKRDNSRIDKV